LETHISFLGRIFVRLRKKDLDGKHTQSDFFIDYRFKEVFWLYIKWMDLKKNKLQNNSPTVEYTIFKK